MIGLKFEIHSLPASWASAMINMDYSGLATEQKTAVIKWKMEAKAGLCADVSEQTFFGQFNSIGYELAEYKFIKI